jgi:hypothetical protein
MRNEQTKETHQIEGLGAGLAATNNHYFYPFPTLYRLYYTLRVALP